MHDDTRNRSQFLRYRNLTARWNCSNATIWRLVQRGELPKPTRISAGIVGWRSDVIELYEAARDGRQSSEAGK
jgi:predicted DNA-binding transcriptional regulator AlpA